MRSKQAGIFQANGLITSTVAHSLRSPSHEHTQVPRARTLLPWCCWCANSLVLRMLRNMCSSRACISKQFGRTTALLQPHNTVAFLTCDILQTCIVQMPGEGCTEGRTASTPPKVRTLRAITFPDSERAELSWPNLTANTCFASRSIVLHACSADVKVSQ